MTRHEEPYSEPKRARLCKSCGRAADPVWIDRAQETIFENFSPETASLLRHGADSYAVSLARASGVTDTVRGVDTVRFEETINGRNYIIEVSAVDRDRWRAQILRRPGASTALMPFYGATAIEAAQLLSQWLTRAAAGNA